ncbi:hypothetical protein BGZ72_003600 [Mortierella alpina]|nr:hypothetical protein BGZ72_003600 [Mortierella alpina]
MVVKTILANSAATLQKLYLTSTPWLRGLDVAMILRTCPELRVLEVKPFCSPAEPPTLQDLVEVPWACTRLEGLELVVTDVRNSSLGMDMDGKRKRLALLVLKLHQQFQALEALSCYRAYGFWKDNFDNVPTYEQMQAGGWRMTEDILRRLTLKAW